MFRRSQFFCGASTATRHIIITLSLRLSLHRSLSSSVRLSRFAFIGATCVPRNTGLTFDGTFHNIIRYVINKYVARL